MHSKNTCIRGYWGKTGAHLAGAVGQADHDSGCVLGLIGALPLRARVALRGRRCRRCCGRAAVPGCIARAVRCAFNAGSLILRA